MLLLCTCKNSLQVNMETNSDIDYYQLLQGDDTGRLALIYRECRKK